MSFGWLDIGSLILVLFVDDFGYFCKTNQRGRMNEINVVMAIGLLLLIRVVLVVKIVKAHWIVVWFVLIWVLNDLFVLP